MQIAQPGLFPAFPAKREARGPSVEQREPSRHLSEPRWPVMLPDCRVRAARSLAQMCRPPWLGRATSPDLNSSCT